jgi:hypothetical protein
MVGIRVNRLELDEAWSFVGKKQKYVLRHEIPIKSEQYVFIGMANAEGDHRCASASVMLIRPWNFCMIFASA